MVLDGRSAIARPLTAHPTWHELPGGAVAVLLGTGIRLSAALAPKEDLPGPVAKNLRVQAACDQVKVRRLDWQRGLFQQQIQGLKLSDVTGH
jgi:hypothetical protein